MAYNKVIYGGDTLIDLTGDTVTEERLLTGYTAHRADGTQVEGACPFDAATGDATAAAGDIASGKTAYAGGAKVTGTFRVTHQGKSVIPALAAQTVTPDTGYDYLDSVTVAAIPCVKTENAAGGTTVTIGG